jgi:Uncharacterized protein with SCP/PR1 domains
MRRSHSSRLPHLVTLPVVAFAAACASAPAPASTSPVARPSAPATSPVSGGSTLNATAVAEEMIDRTNAARRAAGMPGLAKSVNLMQAAQLQADQMVKAGRMEHELPGQPYPTLKSRLAVVQYDVRAAGENIAEGQRSAAEALSTWMSSPGHRANILSSDYTEVGAGVAAARNGRLYFVQVFGRPARTSSTTRVARPG